MRSSSIEFPAIFLTLLLTASCLPSGGGSNGDGDATVDIGSSDTAGDLANEDGQGADSSTMPDCGNGSVETGEACDGSDFAGQSCQDFGFTSGSLTCTSACEIDTSTCEGIPQGCGDGELGTDEACEGFDLRGETCQSQGFYSGSLACSETCRLDTSGCTGTCGDGVVNGPEVCDDGINDGSYGSCSADCSQQMAYCGDDEVNGPEVCDNGDNTGSYEGCSTDCLSEGPFCGDGVRNGPEDCDGQDFGGDSCQARGWDHGQLDCTQGCNTTTGDCKYEYKQISGRGLSRVCGIRSDDTIGCSNSLTIPSGTFKSVCRGNQHACAIRPDGTVECWGDNRWGESNPPSSTFNEIACGHQFTCGIQSDGSITCWGFFGYSSNPSWPTTGNFTQIAAGYSVACVLDSDGEVECRGDNPDGLLSPPPGPFEQIAVGEFACGIKSDQSLECWGPVEGTPPTGSFDSLALSDFHGCAVQTDGTVSCWGEDSAGETSPPSDNFVQLAAGLNFTCGILASNSTVKCWGDPINLD